MQKRPTTDKSKLTPIVASHKLSDKNNGLFLRGQHPDKRSPYQWAIDVNRKLKKNNKQLITINPNSND